MSATVIDTRYEVTECGMEGGHWIIHVLDTAKVGPNRAPKSASRYYRLLLANGWIAMRRDGTTNTRRVTERSCTCEAGTAKKLCVHRVIARKLAEMGWRF